MTNPTTLVKTREFGEYRYLTLPRCASQIAFLRGFAGALVPMLQSSDTPTLSDRRFNSKFHARFRQNIEQYTLCCFWNAWSMLEGHET